MKLSEKLVYPTVRQQGQNTAYPKGITYKEALVLALASNSQMVANPVYKDWEILTAKYLVKAADAIIKKMEDK